MQTLLRAFVLRVSFFIFFFTLVSVLFLPFLTVNHDYFHLRVRSVQLGLTPNNKRSRTIRLYTTPKEKQHSKTNKKITHLPTKLVRNKRARSIMGLEAYGVENRNNKNENKMDILELINVESQRNENKQHQCTIPNCSKVFGRFTNCMDFSQKGAWLTQNIGRRSDLVRHFRIHTNER